MARSRIVEQAIEEYLERYGHLARDHHCLGLLVATGPAEKCGSSLAAGALIQEYDDVIKAHLHLHDSGYCVEVLMVSGSASRIRSLFNALSGAGKRIRFVPLDEED